MARPAKNGLDYYPMDVGFLRDKKVKLLRAEFGASSVLFVLYVFGKAYDGDGYFLKWDKDELLLAADELRESPTYISEVLQGCLSRSLFDERVFQVFGVLTSAGIQRRYLRGCEKRDVITFFNEYWLLDIDNKNDVPACIRAKLAFIEVSGGKNPVNSPVNPVNSPGNPQSKVKESKVKESKGNSICAEPETVSTQNVISLPLNDGSEFGITEDLIKEFSGLYPAVDVMQALRNMRGWLMNNPKKRKTRAGIRRFINSWLSREQDKPRTARPSKAPVPYGATGELGEAELEAIRRVLSQPKDDLED